MRHDGGSRFLAILGTGLASEGTANRYERGRDIVAVDMSDGSIAWRYSTKCPLTSDIVAFETDDKGEPGAPDLDGFTDRIVFADACGYVYKVDPASELGGDWATGSGPIDAGADGRRTALFSTEHTDGALGEDRPIAGTIGARSDGDDRVVLFFGTGGIESYDPSRPNEFYGVYADTGEIRSVLEGECSGGRCETFYGGVVVTSEQVVLTRAVDPPVGTGICEYGSSEIQGLRLDDRAGDFAQDFSVSIGSASVSSLFGDAGAVYAATLGGEVVRVGAPRAADAGGDTGAGHTGNTPETDDDAAGDPLTIMGWREVH